MYQEVKEKFFSNFTHNCEAIVSQLDETFGKNLWNEVDLGRLMAAKIKNGSARRSAWYDAIEYVTHRVYGGCLPDGYSERYEAALQSRLR